MESTSCCKWSNTEEIAGLLCVTVFYFSIFDTHLPGKYAARKAKQRMVSTLVVRKYIGRILWELSVILHEFNFFFLPERWIHTLSIFCPKICIHRCLCSHFELVLLLQPWSSLIKKLKIILAILLTKLSVSFIVVFVVTESKYLSFAVF